MPRPTRPRPTDAELEILHVLWEAGAAPLSEICAALRQKRAVATTTVATVLKVMEQKGLVRRRPGGRHQTGTRHQTGGRRSLWSARVSRTDAANRLLRGVLDRVFDGSAHRLVAHLVESGQLSKRERRELQKLLEDEPRDF